MDRLALGRAAASGVNVRLIAADTWHLTLAFLGEVPPPRVDDVIAALGAVAAGWPPRPAPRLRLAGGGRFGRGRFTVLWVGLDGDTAGLVDLGRRLRAGLRRVRIHYDERPLRPHLTIARPGDRRPAEEVAADLAALGSYRSPEWTVAELQLMRSHLGPKPTYDVLATAALGAT